MHTSQTGGLRYRVGKEACDPASAGQNIAAGKAPLAATHYSDLFCRRSTHGGSRVDGFNDAQGFVVLQAAESKFLQPGRLCSSLDWSEVNSWTDAYFWLVLQALPQHGPSPRCQRKGPD
jgi:hypothetical protein